MSGAPLYWIEFIGGELWVAGQVCELVAGLIPGYLDLKPRERVRARRDYARQVMGQIQQGLFDRAVDEQLIDLATVPAAVIDRMLGRGPEDSSPWELQTVPLLVLGGNSSSWRPPAGRVIVIDARADATLMLSLAAVGLIRSLGVLTGPALLPHPLGL